MAAVVMAGILRVAARVVETRCARNPRPLKTTRPARTEVGAGPVLRARGQIRLNTSVPLVPPKPKPLDTVISTLASRAVLGT
ncbi:hypothetical protein [Lysobacter gummosus]|uniref:hypothetical protein n=1 Tax=Lysobacter gummosus TaxID=262324 RepID=UPI003643FCD6